LKLVAPTVSDLLNEHRAQLHIDAKWFSPSTLRAMHKDLIEHSASLSKRGDLAAFDRATAARASISFVLGLVESRRNAEEARR
jgi:hypothetical protein